MQDAKNKFNTKKNRLRESHSNYRFSQAALFISPRPGTGDKKKPYICQSVVKATELQRFLPHRRSATSLSRSEMRADRSKLKRQLPNVTAYIWLFYLSAVRRLRICQLASKLLTLLKAFCVRCLMAHKSGSAYEFCAC